MRVSFTTRDGESFELDPLGFGARLWARINTRMDDSSFLRVICVLFLLIYFRDLFVFRYPAAASLGGVSLLFTALLFPSILERPVYWLILLVPNTWMILKTPYFAANHAFLELYMILTYFIVSRMKEPNDRVGHLQRMSKVLLSLVMISAVLHKLLSSSFLNGQLFYFRWLTDIFIHDRINTLFFADYRELAGRNWGLFDSYISTAWSPEAPVFETPMDLLFLFQILAIVVAVAEASIPIICLVPRIERVKHLVILPFVIGTALCTPEFTFLTLVALMGLSQCKQDESKTRWGYVAVIILMNAYGYAFVWFLAFS